MADTDSRRGVPPPILTLRDHAERHPAKIAADFRAIYHTPYRPGTPEMTWGEAWHLFAELMADPASRLRAEIAGWDRPATATDMALWDLYDMLQAVNSRTGKPKAPHKRPWDARPHTYGVKPSKFTDAQRRAILAQRGGRDVGSR